MKNHIGKIVDSKRGNVGLVLHQDGQMAGMETWHQRHLFRAVAFMFLQVNFSNSNPYNAAPTQHSL